MTILATARALMALLQPLTGNRSMGTATVRSSPGPSAVLPANAYAVPILGGAMRHDLLVRVNANPAAPTPPATVQGDWAVVAAGTPVTMTSLMGGIDVNLPIGTELRWWPARAGVEAKSVLATALTGGTQLTGVGALAQVAFYEQLRANLSGTAEDLFKSMVSRFPAALLVWDGAAPGDGSTVSPLERGDSRVGNGIALYAYTWDLFVITSRTDSDPARREEGLALLDEIIETIQDRQSVDGVPFSAPSGVQIRDVRRHVVGPSFYVYLIRFATVSSVKKRDPRTWNPWLLTRLDADTPDGPPQGPLPMIDNNRFPMPT
jgi:hypothetical protein